MPNYQIFQVENMVGTPIVCAIANHDNRIISFEQENSVQTMVGYLRSNKCKELIDAGYIQVWRNLDNYITDNNIQ